MGKSLNFFLISCLLISSSFALEVDSKFIARILGASDSKKTILINKGKEIGLILESMQKYQLPLE